MILKERLYNLSLDGNEPIEMIIEHWEVIKT